MMKICAACSQELSRKKFSRTQWEFKQIRRCKECIANNRECTAENRKVQLGLASANDNNAPGKLERAEILAEAAALKKSAVDYMHPEVGVSTTDATLFGRNYFNLPSAPETDEDDDADEVVEMTQNENATQNEGSIQQLINRMQNLETRTESLDRKISSLQQVMEIMRKDVDWKYSAPEIPTSYWIDQGWNDDEIWNIEKFLRRINTITHKLRNESVDESGCYIQTGRVGGVWDWMFKGITSSIKLGGQIIGRVIHDKAIIPHMREFADALQIALNSSTEKMFSIAFQNMSLELDVIRMLAPVLKGERIKSFCLTNNDLGGHSWVVIFAIEIIRECEMLEQFRWERNDITNQRSANDLIQAIIDHPRIDDICLGNCWCGGYDAISRLFSSNKRLVSISLEEAGIATDGGTEIPNFLAANPPLRHLNLANNNLNDEDAASIATALNQNTNLLHLCLGSNDITEVGCDVLCNAVFDHTSMSSISCSNHTCEIEGIDSDARVNRMIGRYGIDVSSQGNRSMKIYWMLSTRHLEGSNVHHLDAEFGDDPWKLVPKVLECVRVYEQLSMHSSMRVRFDLFSTMRARFGLQGSLDDVYPLSVMYEVLRSWKMPNLYENRANE